MTKKKIYLICGPSACGKDTLANWMCENLNMKKVISYATRPKRKGEENTHIFISKNDVSKFKDNMAAYTQIGEFEYFTTFDQLNECDIYLIDPEGIKSLKSNEKICQKFDFITIYLETSKEILFERSQKRGDTLKTFLARRISEAKQFTPENLSEIDIDITIHNFEIGEFNSIYKSLFRIITDDCWNQE